MRPLHTTTQPTSLEHSREDSSDTLGRRGATIGGDGGGDGTHLFDYGEYFEDTFRTMPTITRHDMWDNVTSPHHSAPDISNAEDGDLARRGGFYCQQSSKAQQYQVHLARENELGRHYPNHQQWEQAANAYDDFRQDSAADTSGGTLAYDSPHDDEDESDEDPDLLEDARQAWLNDNPFQRVRLPTPPLTSDSDLATDPPGSLSLSKVVEDAGLLRPEKMTVDEEFIKFLASVMSLPKEDESRERKPNLHQVLLSIRVEEPALSSDPEIDMIRLHERNAVEITTKGMQPYKLSVDNDESFDWSKDQLQLPTKLDATIANEKLNVEPETVAYLKEICLGPSMTLEEWTAREMRKTAAITRVSSPLLPLSRPYSPGRLSPTAAEFELTSTPEDPSARESANIERSLLAGDDEAMQQGPTEILTSDSSSRTPKLDPLNGQGPASSSPLQRKAKRHQDLRVSTPLLPNDDDADLSDRPKKKAKTVAFMDELEEFIPSPAQPEEFAAIDETMAAITEMIAPLAQPVIERLTNEELNEADTVLRVPTPEIAEKDEWNEHCQTSRNTLMAHVVEGLPRDEKKWNLPEGELGWYPFPSHLGRIKPDGPFDDGSLARYMAELNLEGEVDLKSLTWKPDGLRLLDVDEDEEDEISVHEYDSDEEDEQDSREPVDDLLPPPAWQQRTVRVAAQASKPPAPVQKAPDVDHRRPSDLDLLVQKRKQALEQDAKAKAINANAPASLFDNTGLSAFCQHQKWSRMPVPPTVNASQPAPSKIHPPPQQHVTTPATVDVPVPTLPTPPPTHAIPVIISSTLLTSSQVLVRKLSALLPSIDLISRTYDNEPDFILSPSTGAVLTTLQKLKQKPLPGQITTTMTIRDRIAGLAPRYEQLLVFVTSLVTQPLDETDTIALSSLSTMHPSIQVTHIPIPSTSPEQTLATYLAVAILAHIPSQPVSLLPEETTWEVVLLRAGLNPFAAQILLKAAGSLAELVRMDGEERVRRFGASMGGDETLRRMSAVLDVGWVSAANAA